MKAFLWLLLLAALVTLGVFVYPAIHPERFEGPPPEGFSQERSQVVAAGKVTVPVVSVSDAPDPRTPQAVAEDAGPLCDQAFGANARMVGLPTGTLIKKDPRSPRDGAWTWLNLWAAWCKPCKEEMPLLAEWADRLNATRGRVRVVFVSLDDDERQLQRYMAEKGRSLSGDFLWLNDDASRARFFSAIGVDNPPTLPVQAILDPSGRLRCVRVGSIGPKELQESTRVFGW